MFLPVPLRLRFLPIAVCALVTGLSLPAAAQQPGPCAPLQGTGSYSQCINDQLTRQRQDLMRDRSPDPRATSPRPVPRPDALANAPEREAPDYRDSLTERGNRDMEAAQRNSDYRTNQLRQQIQRDLNTGPLAPPPLRPIRPGGGTGGGFGMGGSSAFPSPGFP